MERTLDHKNIDYNKICRICMKNANLQSIFDFKIKSGESIDLSHKLKGCCNVDVDINDKLPSHICEECSDGLLLAYDLIVLCKCTDELLRRNIKLKIETPVGEKRTEYAVYFKSDDENNAMQDDDRESVESHSIDESSESDLEDEDKMIADNFIDDIIFYSEDEEIRCTNKSRKKKRKKSEEREKSYKCYACELRFPSRWNRELHEDLVCPKMPPGSVYQCRICVATAENRREFDEHVWQKHKGTAPPIDGDYTKDIAPEVEKTTPITAKQFGDICEICGFFCKNQSTYIRHRQTHEPKTVHECSICSYRTTCRPSFQIHMKYTHLGVAKFKCSACSYESGRKEDLKRHNLQHTGQKPYACCLCEYRSTNHSNLSKHMRKHTQEKKYKCDKCEAAYTLSGSLKDHILKVHQNVKMLRCKHSKCKYNTFKETLMDKHVKEKHGGLHTK